MIPLTNPDPADLLARFLGQPEPRLAIVTDQSRVVRILGLIWDSGVLQGRGSWGWARDKMGGERYR
jgi:hypothetical protein